jgi:hypothetical protein
VAANDRFLREPSRPSTPRADGTETVVARDLATIRLSSTVGEVVSRCSLRQNFICRRSKESLLLKSRTAAIWSQIEHADALLVTGSHRRHPAGGLLRGRRLRKTSGPFFSTYCTVHRNLNGFIPYILDSARDSVSQAGTVGYRLPAIVRMKSFRSICKKSV